MKHQEIKSIIVYFNGDLDLFYGKVKFCNLDFDIGKYDNDCCLEI